MKYRLTIIVVLLFLSFAAYAQTDSVGKVWPSPPERARIKHLLTISSLQSFESKSDFFSDVFVLLNYNKDPSFFMKNHVNQQHKDRNNFTHNVKYFRNIEQLLLDIPSDSPIY